MYLLRVLMIACLVAQSHCLIKGIFDLGKDIIDTGLEVGKEIIDTGVNIGTGILETGKDIVENIVTGTIGTGHGILETGVDIFGNVIKGTLQIGTNIVGAVYDTGVNLMCVALGKVIDCSKAPGSGSVAPLPFQCRGKGDIIFVFDTSSSVGKTNHVKQVSFAANFAGAYMVGNNYFKFAAVEFSSTPRKWFDLNKYSKVTDVMTALLQTPYSGGNTYTDKAINSIIDNRMYDTINGGRSNAKDVAIILTDGQSNNPPATAAAATKLRSKGVTVFAVGIGSSIKQAELLGIASKPEFVFNADDFDLLNNNLYILAQRACAASGGVEQPVILEPPIDEEIVACNAEADIVTVVDSSGSIGPKNYVKCLNFLVDLVKSFTIGENDVQFGSVIFSYVAQKWFDLRDNQDVASLRRAYLSAPYFNSTTQTHKALDLVLSAAMFERSAGGRSGVKKLVILFTDGASDEPRKTLTSANTLKYDDVTIIAVGVGKANTKELNDLASSSSDVLYASDFDSLTKIKDQVVARACENAKK